MVMPQWSTMIIDHGWILMSLFGRYKSLSFRDETTDQFIHSSSFQDCHELNALHRGFQLELTLYRNPGKPHLSDSIRFNKIMAHKIAPVTIHLVGSRKFNNMCPSWNILWVLLEDDFLEGLRATLTLLMAHRNSWGSRGRGPKTPKARARTFKKWSHKKFSNQDLWIDFIVELIVAYFDPDHLTKGQNIDGAKHWWRYWKDMILRRLGVR